MGGPAGRARREALETLAVRAWLKALAARARLEVFEAPPEIATALGPLGPMAAAYEVEAERSRGVFVWLIDYVND